MKAKSSVLIVKSIKLQSLKAHARTHTLHRVDLNKTKVSPGLFAFEAVRWTRLSFILEKGDGHSLLNCSSLQWKLLRKQWNPAPHPHSQPTHTHTQVRSNFFTILKNFLGKEYREGIFPLRFLETNPFQPHRELGYNCLNHLLKDSCSTLHGMVD